MAASIRVEVIRAWPRLHEAISVDLPEGATVADAVEAAGLHPADYVGVAVYGEAATGDQVLKNGDRVELLRSLTIDPKEARRRRAGR